ncbi:MAG TPA: hypothetical protein PKA55_12275 [Rhodoblastus sp.]|nr:hypothetical protein [Rhodoblastus sp.]
MFTRLQKLARKAQSAMLAGRPVLATADIVRHGQYLPRGATGRIVRVRPDGEFDVAFDLVEGELLHVRATEIAPAPALAARAPFGLRILSH